MSTAVDTPVHDELATFDRLAIYLAAYRERFGTEPHQLTEYRTSTEAAA